MERETAHLLIAGANWLTSLSSKLFGVALEGKEGFDHKPQFIEIGHQLNQHTVFIRIEDAPPNTIKWVWPQLQVVDDR